MKRRSFLRNTSLAAAGLSAFGPGSAFAENMKAPDGWKVNSQRIVDRIKALAKYGIDEKGRGYRVAYTQGDLEGRNWFMGLMKQAGLNPRVDAAGNIIGRRSGKRDTLKPIGFGSHIDMVPDGGNYDGTLGSIAALEVIEILNERQLVTEHPLELIIFANEEGGTIGSKAMAHGLTPEGLRQVSQSGLTQAEGIRKLGGDPEKLVSPLRQKGDLHTWLELHIEQGGILEKEGLQIGIVQGIVGIVHWEVTVEGFANHAGATPMDMRQDALLAASRFIIAVNEVIRSVPGTQVGTVGKLQLQPGAYNVIPGKVVLGLEIRDLSAEKINMLFSRIEQRSVEIAKQTDTRISFVRQQNESVSAMMDKGLQQLIAGTAKSMGFSTKYMQSGAGHDSQHMSTICPAAMIFVPSVGGISHSPKEFSKEEDMANGANLLLQMILQVDKT